MRRRRLLTLAGALVLLFTAAPRAHAGFFWAADRLVADQQLDGSWLGEEIFTGAIVPGLVRAYELVKHLPYKTAAENGGTYILNNAPLIPAGSAHNLLGDEAYALIRLSDIAPDPSSNAWRTEVANFYTDIKNLYPGSTNGYIAALTNPMFSDPSIAVMSMAHHVLAAYYVGAADEAIWRTELVDTLAMVQDATAWYPVMALGTSVWALAATGPLDATLVDPSALPLTTWDGVDLMGLPPLLLSHQEPVSGGFYWRFDHAWGYGYTEDTIFGTLGLISADTTAHIYAAAILSGRNAVEAGIANDGSMKDHLWAGTWTYHVYAGEALRLAVPEPATLSILTSGVLLMLARRRRRR